MERRLCRSRRQRRHRRHGLGHARDAGLRAAVTPGWRSDARAAFASGNVAAERERMESVESGFVYYKIAEGVVATTGLVLGIVGAARAHPVLMGVGAGLGCAAMTQLTMEHITHDVAKDYVQVLREY